jgi:LysM repeat protein
MASRSHSRRRPERETDSMEALKPLIVLVLFGTILYGAYSVVQKGPSPAASPHADAPEAPAFAGGTAAMQPPQAVLAPQVELPPVPAQPPVTAQPAVAGQAPAASFIPPPVAPPPVAPPVDPAPQQVAVQPPTPPVSPANPLPPAPPVGPESFPPPSIDEAAIAAAAVGGVAAGAVATAMAAPDGAAQAPVSDAAPTYLSAESALPPKQDDVAVPSGTGEERPQRLATLSTSAIPPASLPPEMPPPPAAMPSSAAFATAWSDAHDKLTAGRYAEALNALSVWYDDPSLGLEESHRLEDLLGQLAGTVIYSQQDLLLPPHVVAPGETLPAIAASLGVSWQLLAKINGVGDPMQLVPGEHLKLIRGPFDAVVSISRRRLSLQLGGAYAGSFPVVVGREFLPRVGSSLPVAESRRDGGSSPTPGAVALPAGGDHRRGILLGEGVVIEGADDPSLVADDSAPASLVVSQRDLDELLDILGPGSSILIRQ